MEENKLITKYSVLALLLEVYSTEFSTENFTEINQEELEKVMNNALKQINEQIKTKQENASKEELDLLQEKADNQIRSEMEKLILTLFNELKSETK